MPLFDRIGNYLERRWPLLLAVLFLVNLVIRWWVLFNSRNHILVVDAYGYLLKALEISKGDFSPIATHSIGWPLFLAPFLYWLGEPSVFVNMVYVSIIFVVLGSLAIFPLAYLGRKFLNPAGMILLLFLFTFADGLNKYLLPGFAEPLFTLLFLAALALVIKSQDNQNFFLGAAALAGLASWVRPNGFILLPILILAFWWLNKNKSNFTLTLLFSVLIFLLIAGPYFYQRYLYFGSPFSYAENSRYFAESYQQVWGKEFSPPDLFAYLTTKSLPELTRHFFVNGLGLILVSLFYFYIPFLFWPFLLYGVIVSRSDSQKKLFDVLSLTIVVWILALMPVFEGFAMPRHLYSIAPLLFIFAAQGTAAALSNLFKKRLFLAILILSLIAFSLASTVYYVKYDMLLFTREKALEEKFKDTSQFIFYLKGRVAADTTSGPTIMTYLPDTRIGGVGLFDLYAPVSGLSIVYPGYFENVADLLKALKNQKATHLIVTDNVLDESPWSWINLRLYGGDPAVFSQPPFTEIYSNQRTNPLWTIRVFKID